MSEIKSLAAPKASFDRRSVVKTAAWSVPVIAAAIAAPAAAASGRTATAAFGALGSVSYKGSPTKTGTAPTGLAIHNTPGAAINGNATVTLTITPTTTGKPGTGIGTLAGGTVTVAGKFSATNVYTITFVCATNIPGGQTQSFAFGSYSYNGKNTDPAANYTIAMDVTLPGGRVMPTTSSTMHLNA